MFESDLLEYVPGGNIEESIEFLDTLFWNIHWRQDEKQWKAFAGDRLLVVTDTKRELEALILGMTIALAVLPDSILDEIKKLADE
jgi:hypothetical protein